MSTTGPRLYRRRPVVISAIQWDGTNTEQVTEFLKDSFGGTDIINGETKLYITTLEDGGRVPRHVATVGDWIIRGVRGEYYACKPDIFTKTYEDIL